MSDRSLFVAKNVLLSRHFRKARQIPQCFLFYLFLPREDLELHSWHSWNSFIFCWFHQNHPHGKREKYHHCKTNDDFPYPIGEKLHTPILFIGINTEQVHDIGFPSLEAALLNAVRLSRICRHFGFAMATGGRMPAACSKMLIFSHLVNFGRNFPSSLPRWQNGLGTCTAWPGREPEVKRPEWVTSVSSTGRLNREDQFQGHSERRRRMCTFLTIFLGFYLLHYLVCYNVKFKLHVIVVTLAVRSPPSSSVTWLAEVSKFSSHACSIARAHLERSQNGKEERKLWSCQPCRFWFVLL